MISIKNYLSFLLTLTLLFNLVTTYSFANQNNSFGKGKIKIDKIEEYSGSGITPFREQVPDNEWQLASDNGITVSPILKNSRNRFYAIPTVLISISSRLQTGILSFNIPGKVRETPQKGKLPIFLIL